MPYTYAHPHPAVATDIAIFSLRPEGLSLLLIERGGMPFAGSWALPGGFLAPDETLDECARRELREETGVDAPVLFHFGNFSTPDRDPRERVISVAYLALLRFDSLRVQAASDAANAQWFTIGLLPQLAFDHDRIVIEALAALRAKLGDMQILFALLQERFTLTELQSAYEALAGTNVEKRNFRKMVVGAVRETDEFSRGAHRPARLFERA